MKAQCIWCEDSDSQGPRGLYYIHQKCFFEISDMNSSIEYAMKYAKGELPKIKANGDQEGYDNFAKWLQAMSTFQKQWAGVAEKIKKLSALENTAKAQEGQ